MWVERKRSDVTQLMWDSAGIVRRRADMKAALQHLAMLHHEVQVSGDHLAQLCGTSVYQHCHAHVHAYAIAWTLYRDR